MADEDLGRIRVEVVEDEAQQTSVARKVGAVTGESVKRSLMGGAGGVVGGAVAGRVASRGLGGIGQLAVIGAVAFAVKKVVDMFKEMIRKGKEILRLADKYALLSPEVARAKGESIARELFRNLKTASLFGPQMAANERKRQDILDKLSGLGNVVTAVKVVGLKFFLDVVDKAADMLLRFVNALVRGTQMVLMVTSGVLAATASAVENTPLIGETLAAALRLIVDGMATMGNSLDEIRRILDKSETATNVTEMNKQFTQPLEDISDGAWNFDSTAFVITPG